MAAELREALEVEARLIRGDSGIFEVVVDGNIVYSKAKTGRFPNPGEVTRAIQG